MNYKIAVIGDFMLDEWWRAQSLKISPEAPVLDIINPVCVARSAGGAGNVARNLLSLGASVSLYGIVGDDESGCFLRDSLADAEWMVGTVKGFETHRKIRYCADGNTLFRVSIDGCRAVPYPRCVLVQNDFDAVIVSDYNKGMLNSTVIETIMGFKIPVFVDPKFDNIHLYAGAELVKFNKVEAVACLKEYGHEYSIAILKDHLRLKNVVVTLGHAGMEVIDAEGEIYDIPGREVDVSDVTGAGDTAIAVLTLEYLRTKNLVQAAFLANYACSLVVQKHRTAVVTAEELEGALGDD